MKFDNLSEDESNSKHNKEIYAKNDVWLLLLNAAEIDAVRRKLIIPDSDIAECSEYKFK